MLYLVRHCSTFENESGIMCSDKDYDLSPKGIEEAKRVSEWFSGKGIDFILTSDLKRASQTANFIKETTKAKIFEYGELRERNVGKLYSNLRLSELEKIRLERHHVFLDATQDWYDVDGVENDEMIYKRTKNILNQYLESEKRLICVTHAGVIKAFLHSIFQINPHRTNAFRVKRGCILEIQNEFVLEHSLLFQVHQIL